MRIILLLFLISTITFSQEKNDSIDIVNLTLLRAIEEMEINNGAQRDFLISEIDKISNKSIDPEVKLAAENLIQKLNAKELNTDKSRPIESLTKDEKKGFNFDYDKFKKHYFIKAKSGYTDKFYPYISVSSSGDLFMRLKVVYRGSSWVFFERIQLIIDGKDYFIPHKSESRQVVSGGSVYESVDLTVDDEILEILKAVANAKSPIDIRFSGEKSSDKTISLKEAEITKRVLDYYEFLKIEK